MSVSMVCVCGKATQGKEERKKIEQSGARSEKGMKEGERARVTGNNCLPVDAGTKM